MTAAPGSEIRPVGGAYRPPTFPCASRVVAISVPHRSYGSAHSERPISVGPR